MQRQSKSLLSVQSLREEVNERRLDGAMLKIGLAQTRFLSTPFKKAIASGKDLSKEPLFNNIIHTFEMTTTQNLKKKARILVPDSCTLIGVVDETGLWMKERYSSLYGETRTH